VYLDVTRRIRRAEQKRQIEELRLQTGASDQLLASLGERASNAKAERDYWFDKAAKLEQANADLQNELNQHRENYRLWGVGVASSDDSEAETEVRSVAAAVQLAEGTLTTLRFLPSAVEAVAASPFDNPAAVYDAFEALDELAKERQKGPLGKRVKEWLSERGIEYAAHEAHTTMGRWRNERQFRDGNNALEIQEHIKFGADGDPQYCLRIYLRWDDTVKRWTTGRVGRHLTNSQS